MSNEILIGGISDRLVENHRELNALCKELDPTRLTTAQADFRVRLMEMIQPGAVVLHLPAVPAEIMVVALLRRPGLCGLGGDSFHQRDERGSRGP